MVLPDQQLPSGFNSPLEGLTSVDNKVITQETSLLYIYEYRRQYKSLHLFTRSCGQLLHKQPRRIELKKEGKPPAFKRFKEQEVIPDWLPELRKRVLQSCSGTFHFRIEGG